MSDQTDLLKQMSGEDMKLQQALQESPPQIQRQTPEIDHLGMENFRVHMSDNGYNTFLTIIHWAVLVQKLSDGEPVKWTDETYSALSAAFVGFGNPIQWEATYASNIGIIVNAHYLNWHGEGEKFRRANPLPHKLIREVAPLFANTNKGWAHSQYIRDLINDKEMYSKV